MSENPLLLLFVVAGIGYPLGKIKVRGSSLGVAAVLFVGLFFGALHPDLKIPELIYLLGLTFFVYTIGIASGPTFFASFKKNGIHETLLVMLVLCISAAGVYFIQKMMGLDPLMAAGMFAGSLNNTPALASIIDLLKNSAKDGLNAPVVGYSLTYPYGVLGTLLAIALFQKLWKIDYVKEEQSLGETLISGKKIHHAAALINRPGVIGRKFWDLRRENRWNIIFGRIKSGTHQEIVTAETRAKENDEVVLIGSDSEMKQVIDFLGEPARSDIISDRSQYDYWRVFVSSPQVVGKKIGELRFLKKHEALITRVRRGDVDLLAHDHLVLEPGDNVRIVCRHENFEMISEYFGNSYKAVSEVDVLSFSAGLALGILLGMISIPLPGGVALKLGFAGGPLVMGLVLGRIHRTGSIIWVLPFGATMMLRQIGLIMFLAGVGTRAGYSFYNSLVDGSGLKIFAAGVLITTVTVCMALWGGYRVLKIPMGRLIGIVSGLQTQPAALGFALEQTKNDLPNAGYAMIHPVATITKILLVQLLLGLFFGAG